MPTTLWYLFHENYAASRGNRILAEAAGRLGQVTFVDAYRECAGFRIDVEREQQRLREHDLVVFQHPFYWYSAPALMKEWLDKVLTYGFAYPPKEGRALHGKAWLSVITTGGPDWSYRSGGYNNFTMSELLRPFQQSAHLCGIRWLPPFVVHGVLPGDYEGITATRDDALAQERDRLVGYINGLDLKRLRSLEPLLTTHLHDALKA